MLSITSVQNQKNKKEKNIFIKIKISILKSGLARESPTLNLMIGCL